MPYSRIPGRSCESLREWRIEPNVLDHAEGSVMIHAGRTQVVCAASIEEKVPPFLKGLGKGWVTAEYAMLPRSTHTRTSRERSKVGGRTMEIQRLIGRSLRSITDLKCLGEVTITLDCDVIQADGGTRTASITGAWVALALAVRKLVNSGVILEDPIRDSVAAISVGIVQGECLTDLDYEEDSRAEVDMNVVMTGSGDLVEVQATAEGNPFSVLKMNSLISLAADGIKRIRSIQECALS